MMSKRQNYDTATPLKFNLNLCNQALNLSNFFKALQQAKLPQWCFFSCIYYTFQFTYNSCDSNFFY